jgi:hypothetical protein
VLGGQHKSAVSIGKTRDGAEEGQRRNGGSQECGSGSGELAEHGDLLLLVVQVVIALHPHRVRRALEYCCTLARNIHQILRCPRDWPAGSAFGQDRT